MAALSVASRLCVRPSVRPSFTATQDSRRFQTFPFAFGTLFCYSGLSQIVQVI